MNLNKTKPKILVFASGSKDGGGSGFDKLVRASRDGRLNAEIVGVVSNHADGGVRKWADELGIPFIYFAGPWGPEHGEGIARRYQEIATQSGAEWFALSGWLKLVRGLDPNTHFNSRTVFNIHPGLLPQFGGKGMHGKHVHEAVMDAYRRGEVIHTGVTMHFVDEEYDKGPKFFEMLVPIYPGDTAETLGERVNKKVEHVYQPLITDLVVHGYIAWDGVNPDSLTLPPGYEITQEYKVD